MKMTSLNTMDNILTLIIKFLKIMRLNFLIIIKKIHIFQICMKKNSNIKIISEKDNFKESN